MFLPMDYAIQLQLLGGVWIIQTVPAVVGGLFTRWFYGSALTLGWLAGMASGTAMVASLKFATSTYPLKLGGVTIPGYAALYSLILNLLVATVITIALRATGIRQPPDQTSPEDYHGGPETS
jgi:SSS family solute:Na+ symporter